MSASLFEQVLGDFRRVSYSISFVHLASLSFCTVKLRLALCYRTRDLTRLHCWVRTKAECKRTRGSVFKIFESAEDILEIM